MVHKRRRERKSRGTNEIFQGGQNLIREHKAKTKTRNFKQSVREREKDDSRWCFDTFCFQRRHLHPPHRCSQPGYNKHILTLLCAFLLAFFSDVRWIKMWWQETCSKTCIAQDCKSKIVFLLLFLFFLLHSFGFGEFSYIFIMQNSVFISYRHSLREVLWDRILWMPWRATLW